MGVETKRIGLVDGDYLIYRAAFSMQKKSVVAQQTPAKAKMKLDQMLGSWKVQSGSSSLAIFLTGTNNFRIKEAKIHKYKDRISSKPLFYKTLREHLVDQHMAVCEDHLEADDLMSIYQYRFNKEYGWDGRRTIIITCDKDLKMVPGLHYNPLKQTVVGIRPNTALAFFYKQLLTGDTVDTIPGIAGIGASKAETLLRSADSPAEMLYRVLDRYHEELLKATSKSKFHGLGLSTYEVVAEIGTLLWMMDDSKKIFRDTIFDNQLEELRSMGKDIDFIYEKGIKK